MPSPIFPQDHDKNSHARPSRDIGPNELILVKLADRFATFRRNHPPQTRIPDVLRKAVLDAISQGVSPIRLRRVCGISTTQIDSWQRNGTEVVASKSSSEKEAKDARVFSVEDLTPHSERDSSKNISNKDQEIEVRLGGWSISIRPISSQQSGNVTCYR